jgi:hypothetical protein
MNCSGGASYTFGDLANVQPLPAHFYIKWNVQDQLGGRLRLCPPNEHRPEATRSTHVVQFALGPRELSDVKVA